MKVKVESIMVKSPECVDINANVRQVSELIQKKGFSHLPVIDDGKLVGIVSKTDLVSTFIKVIKKTSGKAYTDLMLDHYPLVDIMTKDPVCLKENDTIDYATELLLQKVFHGLAVVNNANEVVGMVSCYDLLKSLYSGFASEQFD